MRGSFAILYHYLVISCGLSAILSCGVYVRNRYILHVYLLGSSRTFVEQQNTIPPI